MEGVNHNHILEIYCCCLIGNIDRMFQRNVPDWKGFELWIACRPTPLVLVIELAEAGGQFTTIRSWRRHDNNLLCRFDVRILAIAFLANNCLYVGRVAFCLPMDINLDSPPFQFMYKDFSRGLVIVSCDNYRVYLEFITSKVINQPEHFHIIGDAKVSTDFILFNISCIEANHHFHLIF